MATPYNQDNPLHLEWRKTDFEKFCEVLITVPYFSILSKDQVILSPPFYLPHFEASEPFEILMNPCDNSYTWFALKTKSKVLIHCAFVIQSRGSGKDSLKVKAQFDFDGTGRFLKKKIAAKTVINKYLVSDTLKIKCKITIGTGKNDGLENYKHFKSIFQFSRDSSSMLEDAFLSDVTILVQEARIPVHKCILAARSPVFKAMFFKMDSCVSPDDHKDDSESSVVAPVGLNDFKETSMVDLDELIAIKRRSFVVPDEVIDIKESSLVAPDDLNNTGECSGVAPDDLKDNTESSVVAPDDLKDNKESSVAAPDDLNDNKESSVVAPDDLNDNKESSVVAPDDLEDTEATLYDIAELEEGTLVTLYDIDVTIFRELLTYMYSGTAPNLERLAFDLVPAAARFRLHALKKMCEHQLVERLGRENCLIFYDLAVKYNMYKLKYACMHFISKTGSTMLPEPRFQQFLTNHKNKVDILGYCVSLLNL